MTAFESEMCTHLWLIMSLGELLQERHGVEPARLELLKKIFSSVPPAHRTNKTAMSTKTLKLWSSEDMEKLVDFVVQITAQIQQTGSSDLVNHVAETLRMCLPM